MRNRHCPASEAVRAESQNRVAGAVQQYLQRLLDQLVRQRPPGRRELQWTAVLDPEMPLLTVEAAA